MQRRVSVSLIAVLVSSVLSSLLFATASVEARCSPDELHSDLGTARALRADVRLSANKRQALLESGRGSSGEIHPLRMRPDAGSFRQGPGVFRMLNGN